MIKVVVCCLMILCGFCSGEKHSDDNIEWWQKAIFYQIYPRSFMDSNGDGVGDLQGIIAKLNHLKDAGVSATWLSPIFTSPMVDHGYDISNFNEIDPLFGNIDDFYELIEKADELGIKIILDFVPNHTSDKHEWFTKSENRDSEYEDYYVWMDANDFVNDIPVPPNNWQSVFYGSAWKWSEIREQFYLHQFTKEQPDLNYRNAKVVEQMDSVLTYWLKKGVSGFRVDAVNHMFEDENSPDEPLTGLTEDVNSYDFTEHIYTTNMPQSYEMIYHWRELLNNFQRDNGGDARILMTEAYASVEDTMKYYKSDDGRNGSHIPFNFLLLSNLKNTSTASEYIENINMWLNNMPDGATANWVLGNHDNSRIGTRFGIERVDVCNVLLMTLPGAGITYNGEEIGMIDYRDIPFEEMQDPNALNTLNPLLSRDPVRTPFHWDATKNAGFSTADKTWLPLHPNYLYLNLEEQKKTLKSHFKVYQELTELREDPIMIKGNFNSMVLKVNIFAYTRTLPEHKAIVVIINLGSLSDTISLSDIEELSDDLELIVSSAASFYTKGDIVNKNIINLMPYDALVMKTTAVYQRKRFIKKISFSFALFVITFLLSIGFHIYLFNYNNKHK